jgi:predicted GIY-YIG superfamily endonuclease
MSKRIKPTAVRPEPIDLRTLAAQMPQWKPKAKGGEDAQSMSCLMYPSVYVLKLEDECWYVGLSTAGTGVEQRLSKHCQGIGANWPQLHKPVALVDYYYPATKDLENDVTRYYATMYGPERVRGGSWTRPEQRPLTQ